MGQRNSLLCIEALHYGSWEALQVDERQWTLGPDGSLAWEDEGPLCAYPPCAVDEGLAVGPASDILRVPIGDISPLDVSSSTEGLWSLDEGLAAFDVLRLDDEDQKNPPANQEDKQNIPPTLPDLCPCPKDTGAGVLHFLDDDTDEDAVIQSELELRRENVLDELNQDILAFRFAPDSERRREALKQNQNREAVLFPSHELQLNHEIELVMGA